MKTLEITTDQTSMLANGLRAMIDRNNEILNGANHLPYEVTNAIRSETMKYITMLNYILAE